MRTKQTGWVAVAVAVAAIGGVVLRASPPANHEASEPAETVKLGAKSVTVFPVAVTPEKNVPADFRSRLGEVVGMLLERAGMDEVRLGDGEYLPDTDDTLDHAASAFGRFVANREMETSYALFAQMVGTRKAGIRAIRIIVVDAEGVVVLADETQRKGFAKAGAVVPKDPMTSCAFIAHRLRKPWGLADPLREDAPMGPLQKAWQEETGVPPKEEIEAIEGRAERLASRLAESTLEVCPPSINRGRESVRADRLAAMLSDVGFASVDSAGKGPKLNAPASPNEQEVLWRTAKQVRAYFREHAPGGDYVLVADFGLARRGEQTKAGYVHWVVCDRRGGLGDGRLPEFAPCRF